MQLLNPLLNYLENHSLADLRHEHGVRYKIVGHLVTLAYHQFEAKMDDEITNLCRGLVIAKADGSDNISENAIFGPAKVLAFPFVRFFNYGQTNEVFKPSRVYEKLDGTLIIVYFDSFKNQWNVATRNVPDGSNTADNATNTFRVLFEKAILTNYSSKFSSWEDFTNVLSKGTTYIFELMTPENVVVVKHNAYKAALIGIRDHNGIEHYSEVIGSQLGLDYAPCYNSMVQNWVNFDHVVFLANKLDPLKSEGFVVLGPNWQRLKIKSEKYCSYNKIHDLTKYDILNYILTGEIDDIYALMQNDYHRELTKQITEKVVAWSQRTVSSLEKLNGMHFESRKDLALHINGSKDPVIRVHAREAFLSYVGSNNGKVNISTDPQVLISNYYDKNTKHYSDSFLRMMFNEPGWLA